jgi:glucosamine-6-phosphate deaminase
MKIIIKQDTGAFNKAAAAEVVKQVLKKPDSVLGLATGNTTIGLHKEIVELHRNLGIDFSKAVTFNLDEYAGVSPDDPASCRARINQQLLRHININMDNAHVPNSLAESPEQECREYEQKIAQAGGIDLQIISIGENGHIAFNEPGTPFETRMRIADITDSTVKAKTSLFGSSDKVPRKGITMGIKNIMMARKILLLANGSHKTDIIHKTLFGPVTPEVPASVLQLHPDLLVILDEAAAGRIADNA